MKEYKKDKFLSLESGGTSFNAPWSSSQTNITLYNDGKVTKFEYNCQAYPGNTEESFEVTGLIDKNRMKEIKEYILNTEKYFVKDYGNNTVCDASFDVYICLKDRKKKVSGDIGLYNSLKKMIMDNFPSDYKPISKKSTTRKTKKDESPSFFEFSTFNDN